MESTTDKSVILQQFKPGTKDSQGSGDLPDFVSHVYGIFS